MFNKINLVFFDFIRNERGVTAIEYGILAAGVAVVIGTLVSSEGAFSQTLGTLFESIVDQLPQEGAAGK